MSKHTPGPWVVQEWAHTKGDYAGWPYLHIVAGKGFPTEGFELSNYIRREDAALIAAAPEMLEALHQVVAYARVACRAEGMPEGGEPKRLSAQIEGDASSFALLDVKAIRALIAKAEGGEP